MHRTTDQFRKRYHTLASEVRDRADKSFGLLKSDPKHPSLRFKKVGAFWSARVDRTHRALAIEDGDDLVWVWIGSHEEYERLLKRR